MPPLPLPRRKTLHNSCNESLPLPPHLLFPPSAPTQPSPRVVPAKLGSSSVPNGHKDHMSQAFLRFIPPRPTVFGRQFCFSSTFDVWWTLPSERPIRERPLLEWEPPPGFFPHTFHTRSNPGLVPRFSVDANLVPIHSAAQLIYLFISRGQRCVASSLSLPPKRSGSPIFFPHPPF